MKPCLHCNPAVKACVRCHLPFEGARKTCDTCAKLLNAYTQRWRAGTPLVCSDCGQLRDNARVRQCAACREKRQVEGVERRWRAMLERREERQAARPPHCRDCTALVGPDYATKSLNEAGLCESCARALRRSA